jgi:predicted nucleic acid-binding protein
VSPRKAIVECAYFDTSVVVKRYVQEGGSRRARDLMHRHRFISCAILQLEALSAFSRRLTAGELSEGDFDAIRSQLRADRGHWELVEVNASVLARAEDVIAKTRIRTLDAIHIAAALAFMELSGLHIQFVTADDEQRVAARKMALEVTWVASI